MQMWKSTLTVAATLLQLTQASPTPLISRSDCTDGEVYNGFTIYCATDLAGGDLSTTQATTLDGCIDTCVSTTDCVAVSYVAPFCYLKNVAEGTSSSANVIAAMIESTGPCSSDSSASSYTSGDDTFSVTCGWDYSGYDISNEQTTTFEGCMNACAADSQCYAVSYTTGSWCYLKSAGVGGSASAGVGGSANADVNAASLPFSSTTTTTTTSTTTATSSTTTTAVATGLCINDQGDGSSFTSGSKTYTISCGFDYYGYDISMVQTSTFEDCVSACSSDSDCTALSWTISGFCYMKNGVSVGDADADVMGAYHFIYHNDHNRTIDYNNNNHIITHAINYYKHDLIINHAINYYKHDLIDHIKYDHIDHIKYDHIDHIKYDHINSHTNYDIHNHDDYNRAYHYNNYNNYNNVDNHINNYRKHISIHHHVDNYKYRANNHDQLDKYNNHEHDHFNNHRGSYNYHDYHNSDDYHN